ncbi:MAG TPA: nucleotidyltransferase family protein [Gemmatimonadota bacterium]|nr:nucleotidyltransferase family protein [Gemmatimonadota bacterium]
MSPPRVAGLVLAAGTSSRLGAGSKLLLRVGGEPVIAGPVKAALAAGLAPVLVVLGSRAEEVRTAILEAVGEGPGGGEPPGASGAEPPDASGASEPGDGGGAPAGALRFLVVDDPSRGQGASLAAGVGRVAGDPSVAAIAVILGDEPRLSADAVRRVVGAWRPGGPALRARYRDRPGHPVVFGRGWFEDLAALEGDEGALRLLEERAGDVREVETGADAPADVDTPADYRRLAEEPG